MSAIQKIEQLQMPWATDDPFLFCAFHNDNFPKGNGQLGPDASLAGRLLGQDFTQQDGWAMYHGRKIPGFPAHPHMGFETVTIAQKGFVDHSDSLGAAGRFGQGDVQWMTAGKGVQHSEMFPLLDEKKRNKLLLFQIWLNLPAKNRSVEPYFGMMWHEQIPVVKTKDNQGNAIEVTVIAGDYNGSKALKPAPDSWASKPENKVAIWLIKLAPHATFELDSLEAGINRSLYFYEGEEIQAEEFEIPVMHRIITNPDKKLSFTNGSKPAQFLVLQGKPINEPVVKHGPFVASSRQELEAAFERYRSDEFGGWPWSAPDHVHVDASGRFAKFPDGRTEIPK